MGSIDLISGDMAFRTPVIVEPGRLGRLREVRSVPEAIDVLEGRWPQDRGKKYCTAIARLEQALRGEVAVHVARGAFVAAAKEARVLVPEGAYPSLRRHTSRSVDPALINGSQVLAIVGTTS